MTVEKDIADFSLKGDLLETMKHAHDMLPISNMQIELVERSAIYLEFLAAAFLKETGLKASETELVVSYGMDKVTFSYRKRQS